MRYLAFALLFVAGCSTPQPALELSDNYASNNIVVAAYVPVGTDAATALTHMSAAGFTCKIERGKTFSMSKGTIPIGEFGPMDIVWCDKQQESPVARRWRVILVLDEQDKVKGHSVTTGLVGP
jgi:hypothetical protein